MGEENKVCHAWCDKHCPGSANSSNIAACVAPAREAAQASTLNRFGKVHKTTGRRARLRGQKANQILSGCTWRQTGSCRPDGPRESDRDQPCDAMIEPGLSACECQGKDQFGHPIESRGYEATCSNSFAFTCQMACSDMDLCAWRQTGGCNPDGPREANNDKACGVSVNPGASGYCECGPDHVHTRKTACTTKEKFTCLEACSALVMDAAEEDESEEKAAGSQQALNASEEDAPEL